MKFHWLFAILYSAIYTPSFGQYITLHESGPQTPFTPTGRPRMAAEWEPAIGTLVTWPPSVPKKLLIELANDNKLYLLVETRADQGDAVNTLTSWGITPDQVKFIPAPMDVDASWTRDWGPHAVFVPSGEMKLADGKYIYATPLTHMSCEDTLTHIYYDDHRQPILTKTDDRIPDFISQATGYDILYLPFAFTGGNVVADGQRNGFSTCVITNENRYSGVSDEQFFRDVRQLLGIEHYNIISNFEEFGIQHIDCFMKLLDEDRILVMRPPANHPLYDQYEGIVNNELKFIKNAYGRPYEILRLDTDRYNGNDLAAYSNSLILNKVIYVPLFGIPQDSVAMRQWREAMPGYTVKGFEFVMKNETVLSKDCRDHYRGIGWNGGDALHCRTRAIWDPEMIYISVDKVPVAVKEQKALRVIIKDYSGQGLLTESLKMKWRKTGTDSWEYTSLTIGEMDDHYLASLPDVSANSNIEYFIEASSKSGKKETMPRTAPAGYYTLKTELKENGSR